MRCWGSVAGQNSRGQFPKSDVVVSVPKQSFAYQEVDFYPTLTTSKPSGDALPGRTGDDDSDLAARPAPCRHTVVSSG